MRDLARHTSEAQRSVAILMDAVGGGQMASRARLTAISATIFTQRAVDAAHNTTMQLRDHLVPADGLGELGSHVAELAIRATRMVALTAIQRVQTLYRSADVPVSVVNAVDELARILEQEFECIVRLWSLYRVTPSSSAVSRHFYETKARTAYRLMMQLRASPNFDRALRGGIADVEMPELRDACLQIAAVFAIDLGAALPSPPRPWLVSKDHAVYRFAPRSTGGA
jgi:hypothetical protein